MVGGVPIVGSGASAFFTTTTDPTGLTCVKTIMGSCQLRDCNGNQLSATQTDDNAGSFSFTVDTTTYAFAPNGSNTYLYTPSSPPPSPSPGSTVVFTLQGLSPINLKMPAEPTLTKPSPDPTNTVTISQGSDFTVQVTGGSVGAQLILTLNTSTQNESTTATCTADASTGTVTAAQSVLQKMVQGSGAFQLSNAFVSGPFMYMNHSTTASVSSDVLLGSGNGFSGSTLVLGK
jgi:hypothetical protein